jgi:DNA-directed RNA polymerase subunit alpha
MESHIVLPSRPRVIKEDAAHGVYEIEGLAPGYGHTLGNSLRRIILSSLQGTAITSVKIEGADHEFSVLPGVKEDLILFTLNLKKVRFAMTAEGTQIARLSVKGVENVTAGDIKTEAGLEVISKDVHLATLTDKKASLDLELTVEKGLGYLPKEVFSARAGRPIGTIFLDAVFTPIRRVNYEVENMRVGDRTDYNRLRITIETDGTITAREALEKSIQTMIAQLQSIVEVDESERSSGLPVREAEVAESSVAEDEADPSKLKLEDLDLPARTLKALQGGSIRSVAGLIRKKESDLLELEGMGEKGVEDLKKTLSKLGFELKAEKDE